MTQHKFDADDGVTIVYDDVGPRGGPAVVLCHGLAAAGRQFAADAGYFAEAGYRVLVPDLRGHGRSGKPAAIRPETFTIGRMAADLVAMLDHAGSAPVHWVGNSLGGILALSLLGAAPRRFLSLATFGTAYRLDLPPWATPLIPLGTKVFGKGLSAWTTAWATSTDPEARRLIAEILAGNDFDCIGAIAHNLARYDLIAEARNFAGPILLLRGGRDGAVNRALGPTLKAMAGRRNFSLVQLAQGGHCANLDATAQWRGALLAFWKRNAGA